MINRRRGLILFMLSALVLAALVPTRVADSRFTRWMRVFGHLDENLHSAFTLLSDQDQPGRVAGETKSADGRSLDSRTGDISGDGPDLDAARPAAVNPYPAAVAEDRIRRLGVDPNGILDGIAAYRAGNIAAGDALAARNADPVVRTALEWVALRTQPQRLSMERVKAFLAARANWPAEKWLRDQMEAKLLRVNDPVAVMTFFTSRAPETALGKLALARALKASGRTADGIKLARAVFRESDLSGFGENLVRTEFGADLTKGDFKYRADRLLYKEKVQPALRYAAQAGSDVLALAKARAAVIADSSSDKAIAAVPEALRHDPGLILAEVQKLRRSDKLIEAAHLMQSAPHEPAQLIDGDEWWTERRVLARKLLDAGELDLAYTICASHAAASPESDVEAEFHAGWIALRFLNDPVRAAGHFDKAARLAQTPTSIARIAYWQGRTAENSVDPEALHKAQAYYETAARYGSTYYGQLALQILGRGDATLREPATRAIGEERIEAIRVIELLYAAGEKEAATALAMAAATTLDDPGQIAALSDVVAREQDAHLALTIGKLISQRGAGTDTLAFPTFGIPNFEALANSAPLPVVYSVARQESAFLPSAQSRAGAKGLMQMIDTTAKRTAQKAGLPFDASRLLTDPAFNAKLGAAHLGELVADEGGSLILTFAAYNAGGGRVKQWIDAYGDPRKPGVDPVDWVERIPFTETRNYVQRVIANVGVYRAIFAAQSRADPARVAKTAREAQL